ncbi:MAG: hypothetical protein IK061_01590, partial [Desulfovibrio sp.]|nr:hypothetical protein [Desulfovibrio sp.]
QTPQAGQAGQPSQSGQAGPAPRRPQASQGGDPSLPFGEGDSGSVAGACRHNAACDDEPDAFGQGQGGAFQRRRP